MNLSNKGSKQTLTVNKKRKLVSFEYTESDLPRIKKRLTEEFEKVNAGLNRLGIASVEVENANGDYAAVCPKYLAKISLIDTSRGYFQTRNFKKHLKLHFLTPVLDIALDVDMQPEYWNTFPTLTLSLDFQWITRLECLLRIFLEHIQLLKYLTLQQNCRKAGYIKVILTYPNAKMPKVFAWILFYR